MKRYLAGALGLGMAITGLAAAPASADGKDDYPKSEGWEAVNFVLHYKAGELCKAPVKIKVWGHQREVKLNAKGTKILTEAPDEKMRMTNTRNAKTVKKGIEGIFIDTIKGKDLTGVGYGKNVYSGNGIKGLLWTKGTQTYSIKDYAADEYTNISVKVRQGKSQDLCKAVGSHGVDPGKDEAAKGLRWGSKWNGGPEAGIRWNGPSEVIK